MNPSINLAWDDCFNGGDGGAPDKTFACNTNTGDTFRLIASVRPPEGITQFVGTLCVFDLQSATATMPLWWQYGLCRPSTSLSVAFALGSTSCPDLETNPQFGGIDYASGSQGPNRARLRTAFAISDVSQAQALDRTLEYTIFTIAINRSRTVGTGSCLGCSTPLCIVFTSALLDQATPGTYVLLTTLGERYWATWQGGSPVPCPAATPTEGRTWGQLKSLYR